MCVPASCLRVCVWCARVCACMSCVCMCAYVCVCMCAHQHGFVDVHVYAYVIRNVDSGDQATHFGDENWFVIEDSLFS